MSFEPINAGFTFGANKDESESSNKDWSAKVGNFQRQPMLVDITRDIELGRYCKPRGLLFDVNMQDRNQRAFERASEHLNNMAKKEAAWENALSRQRQIRQGILVSTKEDEIFSEEHNTIPDLEKKLATATEKVADAMTVKDFNIVSKSLI